jgi:uncharacterized membrane protein (UPF0127 family)
MPKQKPITALPVRMVSMSTAGRGSVVAAQTHVADTSSTRRRGLLGSGGLAEGEGLWIVPCSSVHTIGMRFPIDVVYLSRERRVLKIRANMAARGISACFRAHSVLELRAGAAELSGLRCGDVLEVKE